MSSTTQFGLPSERFIRKQIHFDYLYKHAKRIENECCRVYVSPAMAQVGKVAVIASRKVGNAVKRNRYRRWMKEFIRHQLDWPMQLDIVLVAKPLRINPSFGHFQSGLSALLQRI